MEKTNASFRQEGNQLIHTRLLDAPRELVWEVWTNPDHIREWWGPEGFSLTHKKMEVQPGKCWEFIMHGMGMDYYNKCRYTEVIKPSLLSYTHSGDAEDFYFNVEVHFEDVDGKTLLTMKSTFQSEEIIAELDRKVNAIEAGKQTLNKMETYLETLRVGSGGR